MPVEILQESRPAALAGKTAVVLDEGGGLGDAVATAFAEFGCRVILVADQSSSDPRKCRNGGRGSIESVDGDATDPAWCGRLRDELFRASDGLDLLVCGQLQPGEGIDPARPDSCDEIVRYVQRSVAQAAGPLCALLDALAARRGWAVLLSSDHVLSFPAEHPESVAGAWAVEGLFSWAARVRSDVNFLLVRPPQPLPRGAVPIRDDTAISSQTIANAVVYRVTRPRQGDQAVECLEDFELPPSPSVPEVTYSALQRRRWYVG